MPALPEAGPWFVTLPGAEEAGAKAVLAPTPSVAPETTAAPARQWLSIVHEGPGAPSRPIIERAIELLQERGFTYLGHDPVGLPCYRSPSGALLIAVGSCRSLAYAQVGGRLQVVAAARTAALVCRITLPGGQLA